MGTLLSTAEAAPDPGAIQSTDKAANYQIHEKLGSGAFGTVYRAIRKSDSLEVAIKQIRKRHQAHTSSSLKDEIDIMEKCAKLNNKHLLQLFAVFEDPTFCNLVIELATGLELFDRVAQQKRFTERAAREALLQILDGVQALHSMGILHRDLKPENCLYATMGGSLLKIGDFGLGVDLGSDKDGGLNHVGLRAVGSMNYCAPEVIAKRQYSVTTDLWAVGVMMYVLLVGRYPYDQHAGEDCPKEKLKQDVEQGNVLERSDAWKEVNAI
jgi:serine/threonine protein kinase